MATILCDLDGTLLHKPHPDPPDRVSPKRAAMNAVLAELAGVAGVDYRHGIEQGLTDWQITERALQSVRPEAVLGGESWRQIAARAEALFAPPPDGAPPVYAALPGVPDVLHALRRAGHRLGIATGNLAVFALFKLADAGIDHALFDGPVAFGDHGRERVQIVRTAFARAGAGAGPVVVLGDTVRDRDAAAEAALPFLGVGTTGLPESAVVGRPGPAAAWLADLADAGAVLAALDRLHG